MGLLSLALDSAGLKDSLGSEGLLGKIYDSYGGPDAFRGLMLTLGGHDDVGKYLIDRGAEKDRETAFLPKFRAFASGDYAKEGAPTVKADAGQSEESPYAKSIANIESGGKYDLLGPVTRTGDRAHGKYQVMGANIGPWTKEVLGQELTPQQFLANPQAQEQVFNKKFGSYVDKYGPEGAARAWFAGEGGMNDMGRRDQLGTSVADYSRKFQAGMGQQPYRVASLNPMAGPSGLPVKQDASEGETQVAQAGPSTAGTMQNYGLFNLPQIGAAQSPSPQAPAQQQSARPTAESRPLPAGATGMDAAAQKRIDYLTMLYAQAPKRYKDVIKNRLDAEIKAAEPTNEQKNFVGGQRSPEFKATLDPEAIRVAREIEVIGKRNGWDPEKIQSAVAQKLSGMTGGALPQTAEEQGSVEFNKKTAQEDATRFGSMIEQGNKANVMLGELNALKELQKTANPGSLAPLRTMLQGLAEYFGVDTKEWGNVADAQAIEGIANKLAPSLRTPGSGSQSNFELENFLKSIPGLSKTPGGNVVIADTLAKFAERNIKEAEIADAAMAGAITRAEARKRIRELGSVITPDQMQEIRRTAASAAQEIKGAQAPAAPINAPVRPATPTAPVMEWERDPATGQPRMKVR